MKTQAKKIIYLVRILLKKESEKLSLNFLGEVPIIKEISDSGDSGEPISYSNKYIFDNVFEKISQNFRDSISKINKKNVKLNNKL